MDKANWINVNDRMPEQRESMFFKFFGTDKWKPAMFRYRSDEVLVCVVFEDGTKLVKTAHTADGKWFFPYPMKHHKVTHWMPFPEPPMEVDVDG